MNIELAYFVEIRVFIEKGSIVVEKHFEELKSERFILM